MNLPRIAFVILAAAMLALGVWLDASAAREFPDERPAAEQTQRD